MEHTVQTPHRLTFIGGGHLAQALLSGIYLANGDWRHEFAISITGRRPEHVEELRQKYPAALVSANNLDPGIWSRAQSGQPESHILFICTLPIDVPLVCSELAPTLEGLQVAARPVVVVMCPGILVQQLQSWLPERTPIVRSMPNTPVLCRQGATALFPSSDAQSRVELVAAVLRHVSPAISILSDESLLEVVAAISGSAPAHFYYLIESMVSAAEAHGLSLDVAQSLVVQSCLGAGMMSRDANRPIHALRQDVCVPGGSTEKAIAQLERSKFPQIVQTAIERSLQANREMKHVGSK